MQPPSGSSTLKKRIGPYILSHVLGEGGFGKVRYAVHEPSGRPFAIKVLDKKRLIEARCVDTVFREIAIMKRLRHENIVNIVEVLHSEAHIYIVLELCAGGELFDRVVREHAFKEDVARRMFQQLINAIEYCHHMNVIHGDIKPENVLLTEDDRVKLSDFGLACILSAGQLIDVPVGTQNYMAPEVVLRERAYDGRAADIWSAGCVLFVLLAGGMPFDEPDDAQLAEKIKLGRHRSYPAFVTEPARRLMDAIFVPDPARRITLEGIKRDPWFAVGYTPNTLPVGRALDTAALPLAQRSATTLRLAGGRAVVGEQIERILTRLAEGVQVERRGDKVRVWIATPQGPATLLAMELYPSARDGEVLCVLQRREGTPELFQNAARAISTELRRRL